MKDSTYNTASDSQSEEPTATEQTIGTATAKILSSELVDFTNDDGKKMQKVVVHWKNTGKTPVRAIDAEIIHWDVSDRMLGDYNYTIFAVSDDDSGIAPGEVQVTKGFILPGFQGIPGYERSKRVDVRIRTVDEHSGF